MKTSDFHPEDIVTYIPHHARQNENHPDRELGVVTSVNDTVVFVRYGDNTSSQATRPDDLEKGNKTFYCSNENDSVLDGAFGRCENHCANCRHITFLYNGTNPN